VATRKSLEKLHREGLLVPAVRILYGVLPFRKIHANFDGKMDWRFVSPEGVDQYKPDKVDKRTYWRNGGLYMSDHEWRGVSLHNGDDDWLEWYASRGMIRYPAAEGFRSYKPPEVSSFTHRLKDVSTRFEYLYDRHQMLALKMILRDQAFCNGFSSVSPIKWPDAILKNKLADFYRFLGFYFETEKDVEGDYAELRDKYIELLKEHGNDERTALTDLAQYERSSRYREPKSRRTLELAAKCGLTEKKINEWRTQLLPQFNALNEFRRSGSITASYIKCMTDEDRLIEIEDVNRMIYVLNRIVMYATGEVNTVQQVLMGRPGQHCVVCGSAFSPGRASQVTCGEDVCVRTHKNDLKRARRGTK
jgi:predicted nucleic acid-binding Zn ribbon protein